MPPHQAYPGAACIDYPISSYYPLSKIRLRLVFPLTPIQSDFRLLLFIFSIPRRFAVNILETLKAQYVTDLM
jgi:hypothetical protein